MSSLNKVMLIGNLGQDPDLRETPTGVKVVSFSVATTEYGKDASGARTEKTDWHNIVAWDKTAENCGKYLKKGSKVFVEGRLSTSSWEDKTTGQKRYKTEIVATNVQFLGSPNSVQSPSTNAASTAPIPNIQNIQNMNEIPF
jgi:single-strand DNA-binding protein